MEQRLGLVGCADPRPAEEFRACVRISGCRRRRARRARSPGTGGGQHRWHPRQREHLLQRRSAGLLHGRRPLPLHRHPGQSNGGADRGTLHGRHGGPDAGDLRLGHRREAAERPARPRRTRTTGYTEHGERPHAGYLLRHRAHPPGLLELHRREELERRRGRRARPAGQRASRRRTIAGSEHARQDHDRATCPRRCSPRSATAPRCASPTRPAEADADGLTR